MRQIDWIPAEAPKAKKEMSDDVKGLLAFLGLWVVVFITHNAFVAGSIGN